MALLQEIHVHVPWAALRDHLPLLASERLNPEVYVTNADLRAMRGAGEGIELAAALRSAGLRCSFHGPFSDLAPGAADGEFRALTVGKMRSALEAAAPFTPLSVVFHPGFDPLRFREHPEIWLRNSLRTWKALLPLPAGLERSWLAIENIYESGPETLAGLLGKLPSPPFGFCLDTGHFQLFSRQPLEAWFEALGPWLREVHLHDNHGEADEHLPPGQGSFDFPRLFRLLESVPQTVIGTLEMHRAPHIPQGLAFLKAHGIP